MLFLRNAEHFALISVALGGVTFLFAKRGLFQVNVGGLEVSIFLIV